MSLRSIEIDVSKVDSMSYTFNQELRSYCKQTESAGWIKMLDWHFLPAGLEKDTAIVLRGNVQEMTGETDRV